MKLSPLVVEGYYVKELTFAVTPRYENKPEFSAWVGFHYQPEARYRPDPVTFEVFVDVAQHPKQQGRWRLELQIESHKDEKKKFPYSFNVSMVGYFRVDEKITDTQVANVLLYASAPAVLYGAAREALATATGRGPYPAIMLPSVTFLDNVEQMAAEMAKRIEVTEVKRVATKKAARKSTGKRGSKKAAK